ncbi:MAG: Rne/Rng family ribonuclease [candidate division KSB1 bacterium]|nr:Rne/Rng family ribonuclease [candidate division KSB1 bacterium]
MGAEEKAKTRRTHRARGRPAPPEPARREIIINATIGETRIAILEDGRLVEFYVERPEHERMLGNIYLARVRKTVKGMQAAFLDIGEAQDAFLPYADMGDLIRLYTHVDQIQPDEHGIRKELVGKETLRPGDTVLVQVTKEPLGTKGARVSTRISIPGRFVVLIPDENIVGVSKKIVDEVEKRRLRRLAKALKPEDCGIIIRTVAAGKPEPVLRADLENLLQMWDRIQKRAQKEKAPCLLYKDVGMTSSVVRDLFTPDVTRLVVDSKKLAKDITSYAKEVAPELTDRIELYQGKTPIFDAYDVERQLDRALSRKVWLKSGGYLIIDQTEALVAIDVNSGKFLSRADQEQTNLKINLEAAREIARQLRLRDLGGLIIIDFIDMREQANRRRVFEELKRELSRDRAQYNILPMSKFGIVELTRERVRPSLVFALSEPCPVCGGSGRLVSKTTLVTKIERWIKAFRAESKERSVELHVHPEMAKYLTSGLRSRIRRMMWKFLMKIDVVEDESLALDEFRFISKKTGEDITVAYE